ncbi:condensation domain-containing protein, partial [Paenibacillus sp. P3E]|uniref:condensation domain-containing protein n=1 Tax=Paenibacillus sp. P3E TaxID=1349435 RepID=UPI000A74BD78
MHDFKIFEASSMQRSLYFVQEINKDIVCYNTPCFFIIEGPLDIDRLHSSLQKVIQRHESLRTCFLLNDGEVVQKVYNSLELLLEVGKSNSVSLDELCEKFIKPFDLNVFPLVRCKLVELSKNKHFLMFDMHHAIADLTSITIIFGEILSIYEGELLGEVEIQYVDYVMWKNDMLSSNAILDQRYYWKQLLEGPIPTLNLPLDFNRPKKQSFQGERIKFELDTYDTARLKKISNYGTTLTMLLLASFNVLLNKCTGQEDLIVGTPISGRNHIELEHTVGMLANSVPLRNQPSGYKSFDVFLSEVRENMISAFENQEYPLEKIIEDINITREISRNPLFDVMFVMQNMKFPQAYTESLTFSSYPFEHNGSKFDLSLEVFERESNIEFIFEYNKQFFKRERIECYKENFVYILKQITENPKIYIKDICINNDIETEQNHIDWADNNSLKLATNECTVAKILPSTTLEKQMQIVWNNVLGIDKPIGVNENFFELGGHSVKASQIATRISKEFRINMPLSEIFDKPTIREICDYITQCQHSAEELTISITNDNASYDISAAQRQIYYQYEIDGQSVIYNMPSIIPLPMEIKRESFEKIIIKLIERHESLRTSFEMISDKPCQIIHDTVPFQINYEYIQDPNHLSECINKLIKPFNLEDAPLFRIAVIYVNEKQTFLFMDMHHIISDAASNGILLRDFFHLFKEKELPLLPLRYRDYSDYINHKMNDKHKYDSLKQYWHNALKGELPRLNIITDLPRPIVQNFNGDHVQFHIDKPAVSLVDEICELEGVSRNMFFLTVFKVLLFKYTSQEDMIVGCPVTLRQYSGLEDVVGLFVNTLPIRNTIKGDKPFTSLLKEVRISVLGALEHRDFPLEEMIKTLQIQRDPSRQSLIDCVFIYQQSISEYESFIDDSTQKSLE